MKIAFDIDGVIANSESVLFDGLFEVTGHYVGHDTCRNFDIQIPGYTDKETFDLMTRLIVQCETEIEPYAGAVDAMQRIHEWSKRELVFVTAREGGGIEESTNSWLKTHLKGIPFTVIFKSDKKEALCHQGYYSFVEDRLKTANDLFFVPCVYLVNRPWNTGRDVQDHVKRVASVGEAVSRFIDSWDCF